MATTPTPSPTIPLEPEFVSPDCFVVVAGQPAQFPQATPNQDGTFGGVFAGSEVITSSVSAVGSSLPSVVVAGSPNAWLDAATTSWIVYWTGPQTASLAAGVYECRVFATLASGGVGMLFDGELKVVSGS